jgi:c-di-GMP-binding flagellar brake protein YcgR
MKREFTLNEAVYFEKELGSSGFHTRIIGSKAGHYLLLDLLSEHPIVVRLKVNDRVWIHCLRPPACRFETRVLAVIKDNSLLVLRYPPPQAITMIEHRKNERQKVFLPAACHELYDYDKKLVWEGFLLDISESGCLVLGDLSLFFDKKILLSFQIPWTKERIQIKGRVVRCEVTDTEFQSGLRFTDMDADTHKRLEEVIEYLQPEHLSVLLGAG